MNNGAFVFTGMAFLLAVPVIIIAASFITMTEIGSEGVHVHVKSDATFSLFENAKADLDRFISEAGRRASIACLTYIKTYNECLNSSTYSTAYGTGAEGALEELIATGNLTPINYPKISSSIMVGSTLNDWKNSFNNRSMSLGFNTSIASATPQNLNITPVNTVNFYVTVMVNTTIVDETGAFKYNGTIPRGGNITKLVLGTGIDVRLFNCTRPLQPP